MMRLAAVGLALLLTASSADAGVARVWAVNDGEKIERDARDHPAARAQLRLGRQAGAPLRRPQRNRRVPGDRRSPTRAASGSCRSRLPGAAHRGGERIVYRPPAADPTDYVGRPIQIFAVHYMHVDGAVACALGVRRRARPAAPPRPDRMEAGAARAGERARGTRRAAGLRSARTRTRRSGSRSTSTARRTPAVYEARSRSVPTARAGRVPIELEVFDFTLPDENSMHAMLYYYERSARAVPRAQSRRRVPPLRAPPPRRAGARATTSRRSQRGAGPVLGRRLHARAAATRARRRRRATSSRRGRFYGPGREFDDRASAWARSDAWMTFLRAKLPRAITFLYMPDEPRPPEYPRIRTLAENIHSNPGPGPGAADLRHEHGTSSRSTGRSTSGARVRRASGSIASPASARAAASTGSTTAAGPPAAPSRSTPRPPTRARRSGPPSSTTSRVYFYWHAVHWRHNSQKQGERDQNVWADTITFDNREAAEQADRRPGLHPRRRRADLSRRGAAASRRGPRRPRTDRHHPARELPPRPAGPPVPDARAQAGSRQQSSTRSLGAIVPRVFSDAGDRVSFPETGDPYEAARLRLARAIEQRNRTKQ